MGKKREREADSEEQLNEVESRADLGEEAARAASGQKKEEEPSEIPIEEVPEEETSEESSEEAEKKEHHDKKLKKKEKKDRKDEEIEDLRDRVKRQMAEFENFRKRTEKEKSQMFEFGEKTVIEKILPVIDNFERGLAAIPEEQKEDPFVDGMDKIYKQLLKELENLGVKPIEAVGEEFDPEFHNAVMQVESEEYESGIVAQEMQKGYLFHDSVVRHSMVAVVQ